MRDTFLASDDELDAAFYPTARNLSSAILYRFMPRPTKAEPLEYVYVPIPKRAKRTNAAFKTLSFVCDWNYAWEAAQLRHAMRMADCPANLAWLGRHKGRNIALVADDGLRSRYGVYQGLYHLLPRRTLERYGLPLLRRGHWPSAFPEWGAEEFLPANADSVLSEAFAAHVWPLLSPGSSSDKFGDDDPIRLLAHSLDFWVPYLDQVLANRISAFPRVPTECPDDDGLLELALTEVPVEVEINRPLCGGTLWSGEGEAREVTRELVEFADRRGQLRAILDAVRSNRVEEDFSDRWSFAREDFERKLWGKRNRTKVSFVELKDTIPVHGADSEVHENLLWADFLALCNIKERRIIVCLRNGTTRVGDIARELGYANHSPVSKALARIRNRATQFLRA